MWASSMDTLHLRKEKRKGYAKSGVLASSKDTLHPREEKRAKARGVVWASSMDNLHPMEEKIRMSVPF